MFGNEAPGIARVRKIVQWIHESIVYQPGSTNSTTTAQEVFVQRTGVCRDFAHLGITLCRALNIPARIVVGYVWFDEPPQDFHATFEAWIGGRWVLFDPTGMAPVDRLVRIWRGKETAAIEPRAPWAQRMIQIQTALTYFTTAYWKTLGSDWIDGTALHYVFRLDDFRRFPLPSFVRTLAFEKLATWGTLALEFALGTLVWIRELRYPILLAGLALHLSLEYSMNVPLFQWVILSTYVTFIYPEDLARAWAWIRERVAPHLGEPVTVVYDGGSLRTTRAANVLRAIDIFDRLNVVDLRAGVEKHGIGTKEGRNHLLVLSPSGALEGLDGLRFLASRIPLLWLLAPGAVFNQPRQLASAERAAK
jgi:hypothetical protein